MVVGMCPTIIGHAGLRSDCGGSCRSRLSNCGQVGSSPQQEASQQQVGSELEAQLAARDAEIAQMKGEVKVEPDEVKVEPN